MVIKTSLNGVTLVELIIALTITGVIALGIVSADYAIRTQGNDAIRGEIKGFDAQLLVEQIITDANLAQGQLTPAVNKGILIDSTITGGTDNLGGKSLCIRTNMTAPSWTCYSALGGGVGIPYDLRKCVRAAAGNCVMGDTNLGQIDDIRASFVLNNVAGAQALLFTVTVSVSEATVPTPTPKSFTASVSPPIHRF